MNFDITLAHSVQEIDEQAWNHLGQGRPFASHRWYRFGETVLSDNLPIYILLSTGGEPVARATFWLRRQEQLPLASKVMRSLLQMVLRHRPLMLCQSPLADTSGLILPETPWRSSALETISQVARDQARAHRASFLGFIYLERHEAEQAGWPGDFIASALPDPGTCLPIRWPDFKSYLKHLSKSAQKDYRRHRNRAADQHIEIKRYASVTALDEALTLIRNVERRHNTSPYPWAQAMLEHANMVESTWLAAEMAGRLVGCGLLLGDGPHLVMRLLGLDYGVQYAYFQLVYEVIHCAIERQVQVLWGGAGAYEMKLRLGFQLTGDYYTVFTSGSPLLRKLGRWLATMEESKLDLAPGNQ